MKESVIEMLVRRNARITRPRGQLADRPALPESRRQGTPSEAAAAGEAVAFEADALENALCRFFGPAGDLAGFAQRGIHASRQDEWAELMARVQRILDGAESPENSRPPGPVFAEIQSARLGPGVQR